MRADTDADYARLGLRRGASLAQVKTAYRRLALELHPDRTGDDPGSAARFAEVTRAYRAVLAELQKRERKAGQQERATSPAAEAAPPIEEAVRLSDRAIEFGFTKLGDKLSAKAERLGSLSPHAKNALRSVLDIGAQAVKERAEAAIRRGRS